MPKPLPRVQVLLLAVSLTGTVWGHGGQYRGPGNSIASASSGSAPSTSSSPVGPGPVAPGVITPGVTPGPSGPTAGALAGVAAGPSRGVPVGNDPTRWQYWWEWNKDPLLQLRRAVHATDAVKGSDDEFLAVSRRVTVSDTVRLTDEDVMDHVLPALKQALDTTEQRDIVSSCLVAMAKIGRDHPGFTILPVMAEHLRSHDQEIRETAALAMGISGQRKAAEWLIGLMMDSDLGRQLCDRTSVDFRTRSFAAYGLGLLAGSAPPRFQMRLARPLLELLKDEKTGRDLRVAAINALRLMAPDPGAGATAKMLHEAGVDALWRYFDHERRPGQQPVRAHALPALAAWVRRDPELTKHYLPLIAEVLGRPVHGDAAVPQAAAIALSMLSQAPEKNPGHLRYSEALLAAFDDNLDHQSRYFCLMALAQIGGAHNRAALLRVLNTGNKALIKPWAAMALGVLAHRAREQGDEEFVLPIAVALKRELSGVRNPETQGAIAVALGLCQDRAAADDLLALLEENRHRDELAGYLCIGLALMNARRASSEIRALVVSSARRPLLLRQSAVALGKLGDKAASELLLGMLAGESNNIAKLGAISLALGLIGDRRSITPLIRLLHDESGPALSRAFAAVALGGIADRDLLPWYSRIAVDVNYRAAVETLTNGISGILDIL